MDGQNWRNIKGAAEEIPIVTYHYLIGIPNTGTDKLIILDAGDTLRACIASGMNLISRHKHRPWLWKLGDLQIAYAGTESSSRFRGSLKILTISLK